MAVVSLKYKSKQGTLTAPGDVDPGAMIPLMTTTLSTSTASVTFSDIPQNYEHLQVRILARTSYNSNHRNITLRINGDTGSNYANHNLEGDGSAASGSADINVSYCYIGNAAGAFSNANVFGVNVIDILDYTNTNKYTTIRSLCGTDNNGTGVVLFRSGLWRNTSAITSLTFAIESGGNINQYSSFALFGIKRAGA